MILDFLKKLPEGSFARRWGYSLHRLCNSLLQDGIQTTLEKIQYRLKRGTILVRERYSERPGQDPDTLYEIWRARNIPDRAALERMRQESARLVYQPCISVIMPSYNADPLFLNEAIESVVQQCYPRWQLCICDDGSSAAEPKALLRRWAASDSRILCRFKEKNEGIIVASTKAVEKAAGEFLAFMDQDDLLSPDALYRVALELNRSRELDILYSDNDKVDLNGIHREVYFKPDYSPDELLCHNYIGHLTVLRRSVFEAAGGFRPGYDGAQDFDLLLRAVEKSERVAHLPYVLYSWRKSPGSTASSPTSKHYAYESGKRALEHFFARRGKDVQVTESGEKGLYRCRFLLPDPPKVSVILPLAEGEIAAEKVEALFQKTSYKNREAIVVQPQSSGEPAPANDFQTLSHPGVYHFSRMVNAAARRSKGDYLLLLNGNVGPIKPDWIESLLEPAQRETVGVVAPKLVDPAGFIRRGGVVAGMRGFLAQALCRVPDDALIYEQPHRLVRNVSAVTADCLLVSRALFEELGGLSEAFEKDLADVDFCFRARQKGWRIVWTPFAVLRMSGPLDCCRAFHAPDEALFRKKWAELLSRPDPYYNVNLSKRHFDYSPEID